MPSAKLFDEQIATAYGLPEAVLLNDIMYWEKHNRLNGRNFFNGRYWTYNTFKAFVEIELPTDIALCQRNHARYEYLSRKHY